MSKKHFIHDSTWLPEDAGRSRFPRLSEPLVTDVLVIGAGITGLSTALELLARGRRVAVCEAAVLGAGTTAGSTGHLDPTPEMGPGKLKGHLGEDTARAYTAARVSAIETVRGRCDEASAFRRVEGVQYTEDPGNLDGLRDECEAARQLGLDAAWRDDVPVPKAAGGYAVAGCGRIDPAAYQRRLADLVIEAGGRIFEHSMVPAPTDTDPDSLEVCGQTVRFDHCVVAVHSNYSSSLKVDMQVPPYLSHALVVEVEDSVPDALYWDDSDPYYYVRRFDDREDVLLVGGEDHRVGLDDAAAAARRLEDWARGRFAVKSVVGRWSAELFEPVDGLPMIGNAPGQSNVWLATGLSGVGLTLGTMAGKMIAKRIAGETTPLDDALDPSRLGLSGAATLAAEQMKSTANYAEHVLPAESIDAESLAPGEGKVGKHGGCHVAVCRTRDGQLHRRSATCPHLGGVVHWNAAEQTWDCPVHGGRFAADGTRIYGPPEEALAAAD